MHCTTLQQVLSAGTVYCLVAFARSLLGRSLLGRSGNNSNILGYTRIYSVYSVYLPTSKCAARERYFKIRRSEVGADARGSITNHQTVFVGS